MRDTDRGMRDILLNTDDLKTLLGLGIDKVLAIDLEGAQSQRGASQGTGGREETTGGLSINRASVLRLAPNWDLCAHVQVARERQRQYVPQPL